MKKANLFSLFIAVVLTIVACEKDECFQLDELELFTYEEVSQIFDSLPKQGFSSNNYQVSVLSYPKKSNKQTIPVSQRPLVCYVFSPSFLTPGLREEIQRCDGLLHDIFFVTDSVVRVESSDEQVIEIYLKDKLIIQELVRVNLIGCATPYPPILKSVSINEHELLVVNYPYDFWQQKSRTYLDGKLILTNIVEDGVPPFAGVDVVTFKNKFFIISLVTVADQYQPKRFLIINSETGEMVIKQKD